MPAKKLHWTRSLVLKTLAVICLLGGPLGGAAHAQVGCQPLAGSSSALAGLDAERRLEFLERRLRHDARRARSWAWSWACIYSGLVSYNALRLGLATNRHDVIDDSVGTAASSVGLIVLAVLPLKVMRDQRHFERMLGAASPHSDRCALLAEAERLLLRDAGSESFGKSPLIHVGNFAFNMGIGLLLGLGFGHWTQAAIVSFTGIAVGELQSITQPTDAVETLARYRAGDLRESRDRPDRAAWLVVPSLTRDGASLRLGVTF